ncbi:glycosyltransferase family 4 protein [Ectothiorhodospira variabilis]|uniref:glycosyltransferase family 4 protein n=1 Tax=Ectothiorhodospira variabilis TaxID=505694 RepID=UPI001EFAF7A9|nr:glycosyltransferase family 1 protein [Ectothiorhodospira variabilis]MCG5495697.1 glycosyltransferase family 4 protein [Ectothiorhodospira variabilis]MCG5504593.1 glycosyltransferase family 4 protein [Ectothiorhodospira variabilis]MCG5507699.1 glycosyltransferase family 4 protein [Ectothiorhodospira variabilis]
MKIILPIDTLRHPLTGIGRYTLELARGLEQHVDGPEVRYFSLAGRTPHALPDPNEAPRRPGLARMPLSRLLRNPLGLLADRWLLPAWYRWRLKGLEDHLFHSPNFYLPPFSGPKVATVHDLSAERHPEFHPPARVARLARALPYTVENADHLITDSHAMRGQLIEHFGCEPSKVTAIPIGVDACFRPHHPPELAVMQRAYDLPPQGYCLCVATLEPRKNIIRLLDAHAALPPSLRQRYPLVLAGPEGWNSGKIHRRLERAQRHEQVRYLDFIPQRDLPALYAGARLFVYPSLYEGFGLPVLEAMASGTPVVASTDPALCEVSAGAALHVDAQDTDGLALAIQQGLEDELWRAQAQERGLKRAHQLTWHACVEHTLKVYAQVLRLSEPPVMLGQGVQCATDRNSPDQRAQHRPG